MRRSSLGRAGRSDFDYMSGELNSIDHHRLNPGEQPAGRVLFIAVLALLIGAILAGDRVADSAATMAYGPARTAAVVATTPLRWVSSLLSLDDLRASTNRSAMTILDPDSLPAEPPLQPNPGGSPVVVDPNPGSKGSPIEQPVEGPTYRNASPTAEKPLEFLISGDSMTESFGKHLRVALEETGVVDATHDFRYSSGLVRPDFFDWPDYLDKVMRRDNPDVTLIMIGANDGQNMMLDGKRLDFGTEGWKREYALRVGRVMDTLVADGRRVYWLGLPNAKSDTYAAKVKVRNGLCEAEAAKRENVVYVDTWSMFAAPDGSYTAYLKDSNGVNRLMRRDDGIHLSVDGAKYLSRKMVRMIRADYELPDPPAAD